MVKDPIEYFRDLYVDGRLEDSDARRHDPSIGSPRRQARVLAEQMCVDQARFSRGSMNIAAVVSRVDVAEGEPRPIYAAACCIERNAAGERVPRPKRVRPPESYAVSMAWKPPDAACQRKQAKP